MKEVKYIDKRPVYFPKLSAYPGGVSLPSKDNILKVTEKEGQSLIDYHTNGGNPCFEWVKPKREVKPKDEILENKLEV